MCARSSATNPPSTREPATSQGRSIPRSSRTSSISSSLLARSIVDIDPPDWVGVGIVASLGRSLARRTCSATTGPRLSAPRDTAAAGLFISWARPAVRTPSWAIRSLWRTRDSCSLHLLMKTSKRAWFALTLDPSTSSRHAFGMDTSSTGAMAFAVAFLGSAVRSAISPTTFPGPDTAILTRLPPDSFRISSSPEVIT